ncbi:divalent-cation tolerance protein CutA [Streptomyces bambusae]|uniref:Divalent cation tolerance protein CutA n=1 Tax=Streptomyces bambusae TaxID=1550616 RepID=A0ABS6ZF58_9ACTN|nr:divalent-cation tolerance protein CutA [Streptomyces bambusae]MBW5486397.1 divalent cation tolerance protein CutA [Streptomyces bambusae]
MTSADRPDAERSAEPAEPAEPLAPAAPTVLTVLTTVDTPDVATELARGAVEARLAACAQISQPVTSVYRWQGELETAQEWQVLFKTTEAAYPALEAWLTAAHPYDTPEIIATRVVRGSAGYLAWVDSEVSG